VNSGGAVLTRPSPYALRIGHFVTLSLYYLIPPSGNTHTVLFTFHHCSPLRRNLLGWC